MNKYLAMYNGKKIEVEADTSYEAQQKAASIFKTYKKWKVSVYLIEKDGKDVTHSTSVF